METPSALFLGPFLLMTACGGSPPSETTQVASSSNETVNEPAPPPGPTQPWYHLATPVCEVGELKRRNLSWGSVYWCVEAGSKVDQSLQSDLSRLARCVHESVSAFQEEPSEEELGAFLARAHESGLNASLCNAVRRDAEVRTYHGRRVLMNRVIESETETELEVRYRFSCEGCIVAAETRATVARP